MRFRKKPVEVSAYQFTGEFTSEVQRLCNLGKAKWFSETVSGRPNVLDIHTLEGTMTAFPGDWIIQGVKGEFYPCKPDIFAATYEPIDPPAAASPQEHQK